MLRLLGSQCRGPQTVRRGRGPSEIGGRRVREWRIHRGKSYLVAVSVHPREEESISPKQGWLSAERPMWYREPVYECTSPRIVGRTLCQWSFHQIIPNLSLPASHRRSHLACLQPRTPRMIQREIPGHPSPTFGQNVHRPDGASQDNITGRRTQHGRLQRRVPVGKATRIRSQCQGRR